MRAHEFINESSKIQPMHPEHKSAIKGMNSFPNQQMNSGNATLNWRMGIALAGAPDFETPKNNYLNGEPVFYGYTPEEQEMIDFAAKQVGDKNKRTHTTGQSKEHESTHVVSPVRKVKRY